MNILYMAVLFEDPDDWKFREDILPLKRTDKLDGHDGSGT